MHRREESQRRTETQKMINPNPTAPDLTYTVDGAVYSPDRAGVSRLQVSLVDKNTGPDVLLAQAVTDSRGRYRISVLITGASLAARHKTQPDLQARVSAAGVFVGASKVHYNASINETLNVILPARSTALATEYEALTASLATAFPGKLGTLQENDTQQDITYLANKTGWDARAVAMAALADQFGRTLDGRQSVPLLRPEFYYALFRAGYPANADTLFQADPRRVAQVWTRAVNDGVIPASLREAIPSAVEAFTQYSASAVLTAKPLTGLSTLKEMLAASTLDPKLQSQFADLYVRYQSDHAAFWNNVQKIAGAAVTQSLQLDGQLHFLTLNNGPLVGRLRTPESKSPMKSPLELAQRGYYYSAPNHRRQFRRAPAQLRRHARRPGAHLLPYRRRQRPRAPWKLSRQRRLRCRRLPGLQSGQIRNLHRARGALPRALQSRHVRRRQDRTQAPAARLPAHAQRRCDVHAAQSQARFRLPNHSLRTQSLHPSLLQRHGQRGRRRAHLR